jgi:hypothetical protein
MAPASAAPGSVDLIECDDDLERDQHYAYEFRAQRSARIDEKAGGLRDALVRLAGGLHALPRHLDGPRLISLYCTP